MKVIEFTPGSCYFRFLRSKYFLSTLFSTTQPQSACFLQFERLSYTTIHNKTKLQPSYILIFTIYDTKREDKRC